MSTIQRITRTNTPLLAVTIMVITMLAACGGGERELAGFERTPHPNVADISLPDLSQDGEVTPLVADEGELLAVYFGYTNCPDYCPTTLSDLKLAMNRIDEPERIEPVMVTVDPNRDAAVLNDYVGSFFDDYRAYATDDTARLNTAANPFGVTYEVTKNPNPTTDSLSEAFLVSHSTLLYAVDDQGDIVLSWPFGINADELALDLEQLLEQYS